MLLRQLKALASPPTERGLWTRVARDETTDSTALTEQLRAAVAGDAAGWIRELNRQVVLLRDAGAAFGAPACDVN